VCGKLWVKQQTTNNKQHTPYNKQQSTNNKQQTTNIGIPKNFGMCELCDSFCCVCCLLEFLLLWSICVYVTAQDPRVISQNTLGSLRILTYLICLIVAVVFLIVYLCVFCLWIACLCVVCVLFVRIGVFCEYLFVLVWFGNLSCVCAFLFVCEVFVFLLKRRNPIGSDRPSVQKHRVPKDFNMFDLFDGFCCVFVCVFVCLLFMDCVFVYFVCLMCACVFFVCICLCLCVLFVVCVFLCFLFVKCSCFC